jgi:hypothetical protein
MQLENYHDQNLQHLIKVNYQRMMAFEQAAHMSDDATLKSFYEARADESENNLRELYSCLNLTESEGEKFAMQINDTSGNCLFQVFTGKKSSLKILQATKTLEKKILDWYKAAINEIKSLPKEIVEVVSSQYKSLSDVQLQLQYL